MTGASDADAELVRRLERHIDVLAELIGPRHLGSPGALAAACAYIEAQFREMGDEVERQEYPTSEGPATNLVVERAGRAASPHIVLVGAHYDTVPGTPGADDNASAVAMLIEAAKLVHGRATRHTLRFVAFACEEPPHFYTDTMGSQVHARRCRANDERLLGMLCLEMVGYYTDAPASQQIPPLIPWWIRWVFPRRGNFLAAVGNLRSGGLLWGFRRGFRRRSRLPLWTLCLPEAIPEIRLSDNSSFWDQGYPALMITDTSFLRNPHYHRSSDRLATLDLRRLAQATNGVAGALLHLARPAKP
ncbi:MAG: M28 family peptidase [Pirellulaceae bacterium]